MLPHRDRHRRSPFSLIASDPLHRLRCLIRGSAAAWRWCTRLLWSALGTLLLVHGRLLLVSPMLWRAPYRKTMQDVTVAAEESAVDTAAPLDTGAPLDTAASRNDHAPTMRRRPIWPAAVCGAMLCGCGGDQHARTPEPSALATPITSQTTSLTASQHVVRQRTTTAEDVRTVRCA